MGLIKSEIFTPSQNQVSNYARVLAHPARIAILQYIFSQKSCICGDLVEEIGLAQSTISQHLKELKNSGLIKGNIEGTSVCYCIDSNAWKSMTDILSTFFHQDLKLEESCCS